MKNNLTLDAARLFQINDRVRVISGFYQGEFGIVINSTLTVEVKLDHLPGNKHFGWKDLGIVPRKIKY